MILVLAGTAEARDLAARLAAAGLPAVASLAGVTRDPRPLALPTISGGFGGEAGFRRFLAERGVTAVVDATHPFAARITARTARVCADLDLPLIRIGRPGWTAGPGDRWITAQLSQAPGLIPPGARVFVATGRQSLDDLPPLDATLFVRVVDQPDRPLGRPGDWVVGRPPFDEAEEARLFRDLAIDWLIAKDAGGTGGRAKLDAARRLGLPVLMVPRPPTPLGLCTVETLDEAWAWLIGPPPRGGEGAPA
jgi:precorrin-6A/cobalt-precorrin-6A reductase